MSADDVAVVEINNTVTVVEDNYTVHIFEGMGAAGLPGTTIHNDTSGKQGGTAGEYYHLTVDQNGAAASAAAPSSSNPFATIGDAIDNDALLFMMRVVADGGAVEDVAFLDSFFKDAKASGYFADIVAAYSPSWGIKGATTASKLYSITGAGQDIAQGTGASQPDINTGDLNGRSRLLFDGVDDVLGPASFSFSQPETIILGGAEQESRTTGDRFFDGATLVTGTLYQSGASSPDITVYAGNNSTLNSDWAITTPASVRTLIDGSNTTTQVGNNAEATPADAGVSNMDGFTLGGSPATNFGHFSVGMVVLLNSAFDANYATKMAAIYAFSKSAYGTP